MIHRTFLILGLFGFTACVTACEEKPSAKEQAPAATAQPVSQPTSAEPSQEEKAAEEKAAAEAKAKQTEAEKAQAEIDKNPVTECCRALGQQAFMQRSADYMAASKTCGEALEAKDSLAKALPKIKKDLKSAALPDACSGEK